LENTRGIQANSRWQGRPIDRLPRFLRTTLVIAGLFALTLPSGCVVMRGPVPFVRAPFDTIPSDCKEVHSRYTTLQTVLRDTLRECVADLRRANPACARVDTTSDLTGLYEAASDDCVARGEVTGLPSAADQSAIREEIASLSARIDSELR
jgi:hypothetical protein